MLHLAAVCLVALAPAEKVPHAAQGSKHWAFQPLRRPAIPATRGRGDNPIDAFLLARLEKEGLTYSPAAAPHTLLRRVYRNFTGLPPSLDEQREFLEGRRPDAYHRLVDRLLSNPGYG